MLRGTHSVYFTPQFNAKSGPFCRMAMVLHECAHFADVNVADSAYEHQPAYATLTPALATRNWSSFDVRRTCRAWVRQAPLRGGQSESVTWQSRRPSATSARGRRCLAFALLFAGCTREGSRAANPDRRAALGTPSIPVQGAPSVAPALPSAAPAPSPQRRGCDVPLANVPGTAFALGIDERAIYFATCSTGVIGQRRA